MQESQRWRGAMYLLGYAVECSLKAKLMERFGTRTLHGLEERLRERFGVETNLFTHNLGTLMELTSTEHRMGSELRRFWGVCRRWEVHWRYNPDPGHEHGCDEFFTACREVLRFVKNNV
ncbi:MAG: hypothetical protein KAY37_06970 [Phycisphaerae bacterium]|nr:hypothetical protein [Phycisphaerae bacterium]